MIEGPFLDLIQVETLKQLSEKVETKQSTKPSPTEDQCHRTALAGSSTPLSQQPAPKPPPGFDELAASSNKKEEPMNEQYKFEVVQHQQQHAENARTSRSLHHENQQNVQKTRRKHAERTEKTQKKTS